MFEFELTVHSVPDNPQVEEEVTLTQNLDGADRSIELDDLVPDTEYRVFLSSINTFGHSNNSNVITFKTPPGTCLLHHNCILYISYFILLWKAVQSYLGVPDHILLYA